MLTSTYSSIKYAQDIGPTESDQATKTKLDECQALFDAGDIKGADAIIRPLARFSSVHDKNHDRICDLEELIVDQLILLQGDK